MQTKEDIHRALRQIVAQVKAHLRFQKGLGINTLLSHQETKPLLTLDAIRREIGDCTRCELHEGRNSVVFGEGNPHAVLVFVGEAPGREEDLQGKPFVGKAGELLTRIIKAIDLTREEVYIANIVKCRPPQNRDPKPDEIRTCLPFLRKQLETIRPRIICALGTFAAQTLLETAERISALRGRFHPYHGARLMPTYHPAFLLRNPQFKKDVWEDMKAIREEYKKG
ncbi:MAG: uracil-DNA glycosylase [Deltaproteobacteria bacterium RBG_13_52_11]|nr:MAG: uracil-DNA glycosylase [Deltaproteobacteria bacterium RBG_13_52_11]